jgi:hypothetical protein
VLRSLFGAPTSTSTTDGMTHSSVASSSLLRLPTPDDSTRSTHQEASTSTASAELLNGESEASVESDSDQDDHTGIIDLEIPEITMNVMLERIHENTGPGPTEVETEDLLREIADILERHRNEEAPEAWRNGLQRQRASGETTDGNNSDVRNAPLSGFHQLFTSEESSPMDTETQRSYRTEEGVFVLEVSDIDSDQSDDDPVSTSPEELVFYTGSTLVSSPRRMRRLAPRSTAQLDTDNSSNVSPPLSGASSSSSPTSPTNTSSSSQLAMRHFRIITEAYAILPAVRRSNNVHGQEDVPPESATIYARQEATLENLSSILSLMIQDIAEAARVAAGLHDQLHLQGQPPASQEAIDDLKQIRLPFSEKRRQKRGIGTCTVCQETFDVSDRALKPQEENGDMNVDQPDHGLMMPCRHIFHARCILPWLKNSNTCPTCRYEVS